MPSRISAFFLLTFISIVTYASEQLPGKMQSLSVGDKELAYWVAKSHLPQTNGYILLTHDAGDHFHGGALINQLIRRLAKRGWNVVSMSMPQLNVADSQTAEKVSAFNQTISLQLNQLMGEVFSDSNYRRFIVSHGRSAYWLAQALAAVELQVHGFVAIGAYYPEMKHNEVLIETLPKLGSYVLDIFGSNDLAWVTASAQERKVKNLARLTLFRQIVIQNANHRFQGLETALADRINGWLHFTIKDATQHQR